jgi:hypothetical protein
VLTFDQNPHAMTNFPNEVTTSPWVEWGMFWGIVLPLAALTFWVIYNVLIVEARRKLDQYRQKTIETIVETGARAFAEPATMLISAAQTYADSVEARFCHTDALCQLIEGLQKDLNDALNAKTTIVGPHGVNGGLSASNVTGGTVINIAVNQSGHVVDGQPQTVMPASPSVVSTSPSLKIADKPKDQTSQVWLALSALIALWQNKTGMDAILKGVHDCLLQAKPFVPPRLDGSGRLLGPHV